MSELATRMRADLTAAMRARDRGRVGVLRATLSAIANAEAVDTGSESTSESSGAIAGATSGAGSTELERRQLTEDDVRAVIATERDELLESARALADAGSAARAEELRAGAGVLDRYL